MPERAHPEDRKLDAKLRQISEWLGHATISQTVIYAKYLATDEELNPLVAKAGEVYGGLSLEAGAEVVRVLNGRKASRSW